MFNRSRIHTVVVRALTSNLKRAQALGNVLLKKGEANSPQKSVVNISQIFTVGKNDLSGKIGALTKGGFDGPNGVYRAHALFFIYAGRHHAGASS
ncbi:hypothetical protein EPICR_30080 [Candidatus Desulfarcum epimagneticum]|uniref:Uncharacterized protein n=1 Tax=uncultured Desulfobacteraceae bacterium TaxID=218296 RepID=A0A484HIS1_9BACT|nr:hypothetical protein EPICR_30080 [uncultured Desulfobacteraceae bacterium]